MIENSCFGRDVKESNLNLNIPSMFMMPSSKEEFDRQKCSGDYSGLLNDGKKAGDMVKEIDAIPILKPALLIRIAKSNATI
jgi:hypothetical protein